MSNNRNLKKWMDNELITYYNETDGNRANYISNWSFVRKTYTWWEPKSSSKNAAHFSEKRNAFQWVWAFQWNALRISAHFTEMCCAFSTFHWNALRISLKCPVHFIYCTFHWNALRISLKCTKNMLFNRNLSFWFGLS